MKKRNFAGAFLLGLILLAPVAQAAELQYGWQKGDTYTYSFQIQAQEPAYTDVRVGKLIYTVEDAGSPCVLSFTSDLVSSQQDKNGAPLDKPMASRLGHLGIGLLAGVKELKVSLQGERTDTAAIPSGPFQVAAPPLLVVPPLPGGDTAAAGQAPINRMIDEDCSVLIQPLETRLAAGEAPPAPLAAHERITYTIGDRTADTITIQEHYELKSQQMVGDGPRLQVIVDGPILFDAQSRVVRSMELKGVLANPGPGGLERTPLSITAQLVDSTRTAAAHPATPADAADTQPVGGSSHLLIPPRGGLALVSADDLAQYLADLKSTDADTRRGAAEGLAGALPDEAHAARVNHALIAVLGDADSFVRLSAVKALGTWCTPDSVPALARMLNDNQADVRAAALDTLAQVHDPATAPAIAARLADPEDRDRAGQALRKIGVPAAPSVANHLKDPDANTRAEACNILREIGTKAQEQAIEALTADPNPMVALAATAAVTAIDDRE